MGRGVVLKRVHSQTSAGAMTAVHRLDFSQDDMQACRTETAVSVADELIRVSAL